MPDANLISWPYTNKINRGGHDSNFTSSTSGRKPRTVSVLVLHSTTINAVSPSIHIPPRTWAAFRRGAQMTSEDLPLVLGQSGDYVILHLIAEWMTPCTYKYPNQLGDPIVHS